MVSLLLKDQITEVDLAGVTEFIVVRPHFSQTPPKDRWWSVLAKIGVTRIKPILRAPTWEKAHLLRRQLTKIVIDLGVDAKVHIRTGSVTKRDAPDEPVH